MFQIFFFCPNVTVNVHFKAWDSTYAINNMFDYTQHKVLKKSVVVGNK